MKKEKTLESSFNYFLGESFIYRFKWVLINIVTGKVFKNKNYLALFNREKYSEIKFMELLKLFLVQDEDGNHYVNICYNDCDTMDFTIDCSNDKVFLETIKEFLEDKKE